MAVGSYYLLILYRILESDKMNTFLDIGLGQTSKLISQYARRHDNVMHTVIEADRDWIKAFKKNLLGPVEIIDLNYEELVDEVTGEELRVFEHFSEVLRGRKYNYISIDAPLGTGAKGKSRIDVLSILPDCLEKSFVIMIDDINREGEMHTFEAIKTILKNNNIEYAEARCTGTKMFGIITSWDNRFFCSV
jgi:tRNA isopentenyl-2-thiomethyl-A-37 hydroxylase MiaE